MNKRDELLSYYSDFYKDLNGFRPILGKPWNVFSEAEAQALVNDLHAHFDALASTPEGRKELLANGWVLDDNDEHDQFRDDVDADADALRMAGFGTDEDYGYFGED